MKQPLIDDVLSSETELDQLFSSDIPKGIVMEITREGYLVKNILTQENLLITHPQFDYEFARQQLEDANEEESVWVIGYNPVTKVHQEF